MPPKERCKSNTHIRKTRRKTQLSMAAKSVVMGHKDVCVGTSGKNECLLRKKGEGILDRTSCHIRKPFIALLCALGLSGCTTIVLGGENTLAQENRRAIVSVGISRIVIPETQGETVAFKRTGIGLGFGSAVGSAAWLGFDQNEWVIADPAKCQLMVVIRSDVESANAALILDTLKGVDVCYTNEAQP